MLGIFMHFSQFGEIMSLSCTGGGFSNGLAPAREERRGGIYPLWRMWGHILVYILVYLSLFVICCDPIYLLARVGTERDNDGHAVLLYRSKRVARCLEQILVRYWRDTGEILVRYWRDTGEILWRYWLDTGEILARYHIISYHVISYYIILYAR